MTALFLIRVLSIYTRLILSPFVPLALHCRGQCGLIVDEIKYHEVVAVPFMKMILKDWVLGFALYSMVVLVLIWLVRREASTEKLNFFTYFLMFWYFVVWWFGWWVFFLPFVEALEWMNGTWRWGLQKSDVFWTGFSVAGVVPYFLIRWVQAKFAPLDLGVLAKVYTLDMHDLYVSDEKLGVEKKDDDHWYYADPKSNRCYVISRKVRKKLDEDFVFFDKKAKHPGKISFMSRVTGVLLLSVYMWFKSNDWIGLCIISVCVVAFLLPWALRFRNVRKTCIKHGTLVMGGR